MITLIYRRSDRLLVGASHKRRTNEQTVQAVITEINNICVSEFGGVPSDYGTVKTETELGMGMVPTINTDFTVSWSREPDDADLDRKRASELLSSGGPSLSQEDQRELLEILARRI